MTIQDDRELDAAIAELDTLLDKYGSNAYNWHVRMKELTDAIGAYEDQHESWADAQPE